MGERVFRKNQYGLEVTKGTAVAATRMLLGTVTLPPDRKVQFPADTLGLRARSNRAVINQIHIDGLQLSFPEGAYFEALPMIFSIGVKGGITAAEVTTGEGDYLWTFTPSLTASNTPDAITLETGDDTQAYECEYTQLRRITIKGAIGEDQPVYIDCEGYAKQLSPVSFTGSIARPTVEAMIANMTKFYLDSTFATAGTTQKTGLVKDYQLDILTGLHPKFHAAGSKTMTGNGEGFIDVLMTFTFEGNSDADVIFDAWQAKTAKAIQLKIEGSQIGTGELHSLIANVYGTFEEVIPMGSEKDGNNLHTAIFHAHADLESTPSMFALLVTTDIGTI